MALDTTIGGASSDSYVSRVDIEAYWTAIGFDHSAYDGDAVDAAARRATTWLDGRYRSRFPGARTNGRSQALEWPRTGAYDVSGEEIGSDEIPDEVSRAICEAAKAEVSGVSLSPTVTPGQVVTAKTVGPISKTYSGGASVSANRPVMTVVDDILSGLFATGGNTKFLKRA